MTIHIDHAPFTLPLRRPVPCNGVQVVERRGILLALRGAEGEVGYGEAAPLPGLHTESTADVARALPEVAHALSAARIESLGELRETLLATAARTMPALLFGIEMAWLCRAARRQGSGIAHLLAAAPSRTVPLCKLFDGSADAARAVRVIPGAGSIKVKVGRRPLAEERAILRSLTASPTARLRLDGNRSLDLDRAAALLEGFDPARFEFFEEPLAEPTELPALTDRTGIRIALDETLRDPDSDTLRAADCVAAWVVKPTLLGGFATTIELAVAARSRGITCVVSSCFESGLGLWALAHLAAAIPDSTTAGLGTDRWLAEDLIEPPFSSARGQVDLADWVPAPAPETLRRLHLQEVRA